MALSISMAMVLTGVPAQALAATDQLEEGGQVALAASGESTLRAETKASGTWGTCPWVLDSDGVLTISPGQGKQTGGISPWMKYKTDIKNVVFAGDDTNRVVLPSGSSDMFNEMSNLVSVEFGTADTSEVVNMAEMFNGCSSLRSLDLSGFDTSKVTDMSRMFTDCRSITSLNLSSFRTPKVTEMSHMFEGCGSLTSVDLTHFDTSMVENMWGMFKNCSSLTSLDLSSFDTSNVISMVEMFYNCWRLGTVFVGEDWSRQSLVDGESWDTVWGCWALVGGNGTRFSSEHVSSDYACADVPGTPGYFTLKIRPVPRFKNASLTIGEQIGLTFWFNLPEADDLNYSDSYVHFSIDDKAGREEDVPLFEATRDASGLYGFTFDVTSIEMAEPVATEFHYKNAGVEKTISTSFSVQDYFEAFDGQAESYSEETANLVHATADLGYYMYPYLATTQKWTPGDDYARITKHYATYDDADLDKAADGLGACGIEAELGDSGVKASVSASFDSLTAINFFLTAPEGSDFILQTSFGDLASHIETLPDGRWLVRVEGIRPQHLNEDMTVGGICNSKRFSLKTSVLGLLNLGYAKANDEAKAAFASAYFDWQAASALG